MDRGGNRRRHTILAWLTERDIYVSIDPDRYLKDWQERQRYGTE